MTRRSLINDTRGVAAVEFALLLPVLVALYFGVVELTQGLMTQERAAHVAGTVGDLISQNASVTAAEVADVFSVGNTVMYPYPTGSLKLRVSALSANAKGNVTVIWSQASGGLTKLAANSTVTGLPKNVVTANESVIMSESQYTYTSVFGQFLPTPVVFKQTSYQHPRLSSSVTCIDC